MGLGILDNGSIDPSAPCLGVGRVGWRSPAGQICDDPAEQLQFCQLAEAAVDQLLHALVHAVGQPQGDEWRNGILGPCPKAGLGV
eukprot:7387471-Prymnesium_polylepis.1